LINIQHLVHEYSSVVIILVAYAATRLYPRGYTGAGEMPLCQPLSYLLGIPPISVGITDFSYPRPFVPKNERSLWRTFVPRERKFQELSFPAPFVPGNYRCRGTRELSFPGPFVLGNFRSRGTFVPGTFRTRELSFPFSDRPSRRFALGA